MRKNIYYILGAFLTMTAIGIISAGASSVITEKTEQKDVVPFQALQDYQILLTGNEGGVSTYSGTKNNVRISFESDAEKIKKIIIAFDYNTGDEEKNIHAQEIIDVVNRLMPHKLQDLPSAAVLLKEKLSAMNQTRDEDIFSIEQLRFEAHINNGMVNLRITQ